MSIHQQKMVRFTVDLPMTMHKNLKVACAEDSITMHACVIKALENWYNERTDRIDMELIAQSEKEITQEGTISLEEWERQDVQD